MVAAANPAGPAPTTAIFLVILAFSINLLGDWMRDTLNPKLN